MKCAGRDGLYRHNRPLCPLVFWTGIMGQFMGYMPKTIIIVLIASLVVAIGALPVLTSKLMKIGGKFSLKTMT